MHMRGSLFFGFDGRVRNWCFSCRAGVGDEAWHVWNNYAGRFSCDECFSIQFTQCAADRFRGCSDDVGQQLPGNGKFETGGLSCLLSRRLQQFAERSREARFDAGGCQFEVSTLD